MHVAFAAVGLSALLLRSAVAFEVVKYAGAAYLIVLGIRRLLAKDVAADPDVIHERSHWKLYRQGVVVNVLNPKTALFFFAFLPQFVNPDAGRVGVQIALLGLVFIAVAFTSDARTRSSPARPEAGSRRAAAISRRSAGCPAASSSASAWRPRCPDRSAARCKGGVRKAPEPDSADFGRYIP